MLMVMMMMVVVVAVERRTCLPHEDTLAFYINILHGQLVSETITRGLSAAARHAGLGHLRPCRPLWCVIKRYSDSLSILTGGEPIGKCSGSGWSSWSIGLFTDPSPFLTRLLPSPPLYYIYIYISSLRVAST